MQTAFNWGWDRKTREERKTTICAILQSQDGLTTRMIAHRLGLKKTPYIREMLIELEAQGLIYYTWENMTNGARCMVWHAGANVANFDPEVEDDEGYIDLNPPDADVDIDGPYDSGTSPVDQDWLDMYLAAKSPEKGIDHDELPF